MPRADGAVAASTADRRARGVCTRCGRRPAAESFAQCTECQERLSRRRPIGRPPVESASRPWHVCCQSSTRHRAGCTESVDAMFDTSDAVELSDEDAELLGLDED